MSNSTDSDREFITPEQLDAMMTDGEFVHTFTQAGHAILGFDMKRTEILAMARSGQAELSGEVATRMKHGAVVTRDGEKPLFVETKPTP